MQLRSSALLISALIFSGAAFAHQYDSNKPVTLTGTVKKVEWNKPYVKMHMDVADTNGKTKDWEIETAAPSVLESNGLASTSIKEGDRITVQGDQASDGSDHALARSMTLADGRTTSINSTQTASNTAPSTLPKTATNLPLIGLIGLIAVGAGTVLRRLRRLS